MELNHFSVNYDALKCVSCKTTTFLPRADAPEVKFSYSSDSDKYSQEDYLFGSVLRWSHRRLLRRDWRGRSVLEVGCFNGFFLSELRDMGAEVFGVDVNLAALQAGRQIFNLNTIFNSLEAVKVHGPFDDIVCVDVLEHVDNPEEFILQLRQLIRVGGRLFIAGPTTERIMHDKSDYPPHHKWWFTRRGLAEFLRLSGFRVVKVDIQRDGLLMFRNACGKLVNGFFRKEFHGRSIIPVPKITWPLFMRLYSMISIFGIALFTILGISYCSTLIEMECEV